MIQFEGVYKRFSNQHQALNNVTFHLEKGAMAFLTGHSGAGKSTLLKIITKMQDASQGQVYIAGKNLSKISRHALALLRQRIGMIFQNPMLLSQRTVFDNVALPLHISGMRNQEIQHRVRAALDKVSLLNKEKYLPSRLSVGEQQRVGIARAVVNRPDLLLADEPTGNLDPALSNEIMRLFEQFNQVGTTVLIATHDLGLIAQMAHPILTLKNGHLLQGAVMHG